ncbi:anthranilate synthase component II-like [Hibiscus syriacus]|uniref:Anthranilate synthase component II-like n=1 Tax=Hibiscus syriacus TaxID=106335 RepID=A0A6A3B7C4_HIBSY|nr:anthranilate synthase component II-like [Hibiscus syriacus]
MTDLLCHHLLEIGEAGKYDAVIVSIQQRRYSWNPVLHMQQYFPVTDVSCALQQAAWRRRRRQRLHDRGTRGMMEWLRKVRMLSAEVGNVEDKSENNLHSSQSQNGKLNLATSPTTFVGNEVNVVDGLKLYEELFDEKEVSNLVSLVEGDDWTTEAIPALLQDAIERLVELQVMTAKPDSCIIDVYNEGDHLQPRTWPPWFGKPVCLLFLTECNITFGRVIAVDHPEDFRGSLKLSLAPGLCYFLTIMQIAPCNGRKSAGFAKHALPSVQNQRILVTFTKYQPRKFVSGNQRLPLPMLSQSSQEGLARNRPPNHFRPAAGPKHYAVVPTTQPQTPPPNGVRPFFVPAPVAPAIPFPAPVPIPPGMTTWPAPPPRHPPPHQPVSSTGVFLPPPGSDNSSQLVLEQSSYGKSQNQDCTVV